MTSAARPEVVIAETLRWVGTPYRHQGSRRGVGCDCLGLVRGVWRAVVGPEPETAPAYAAAWNDASRDETLLDAAARRLLPTDSCDPGAILVFRWRAGAAARHCGVLVASDRLAHAYSGHGVVVSPFGRAWRSRVAGQFLFPSPSAE